MTVKTLVEARGLDVTELPADFLTNLEDYVDRVQTKRGGGKKARARRERRTALATTLLDQERDVVRTREMIVGQLTGTTSVVQAKQATEDAARARKRLDQLQEEVPKLKKTKRKQEALDEAKDQMEALKQATEAWAKTVSDLVDQIRQAERGLQDFQIQMFETIDGLTGATDTGQKYQSFLDDNEKKYNDLVTAGSSAGAQLELVNRQLQLLQAQAQATIQDINEQAQAYHDAIQRQRDVLDAYTEAIERESRIEQRAIRDLQDDIDKNQKEIETRQDKLDELADRRSKLQDRLSDISPLADLTDGLKQMKESLTGTIKGGGFAELAQTRQKLGEAVAQFQGETDLQKKATAGAEVQRLAGLAVEQGQKLYSVGSRDLTRLRQQSLAAIEGVLETAQAAEDERTKILADIKSIDEEAKGIQEEIKGYQKKIKEDNEKIEGHTKRLRDLADAQQIIDDKRKPLDDADRAIAKAQAEKIDEVNQKLAAQLKIWSDKAVPLMQAQIGNLREQLKAIVPPGTDIDALINDPSSLQAFLAQAQLETLQSIEDYLEGFSKSLNIPPRPGKRHRTTAAAAEGGIILRDSIIRAGEGNKPEVIIPLESPRGRRLLGLDRPVPRNGGAHEPTFIFQPTIVMPQPKSMAEAKLYGRSASSGFSAQVKQALPGITRRAGGRG
jgi:chromosome segregation ATPase